LEKLTANPYRDTPIQERSHEYRIQPNEDKETMTKEKKSKPEVPLKPQVHETMRLTGDSYAHDKETVHSVHNRETVL
jgi:hypothetical protein